MQDFRVASCWSHCPLPARQSKEIHWKIYGPDVWHGINARDNSSTFSGVSAVGAHFEEPGLLCDEGFSPDGDADIA